MRFYTYPCVFGHFCLVTEEDAICGIELAKTAEEAAFLAGERFAKVNEDKCFEKQPSSIVDAAINCINNGVFQNVKIRYKLGTWLQTNVWSTLSQTKVGETISYKELADRAGYPTAIRPVASAVAANPIAIIIPCHRVILGDGSVGRYHWGAEIKEKLLEREFLAANPTEIVTS